MIQPSMIRINNNSKTKKLYDLEEIRNETITKAAKELAVILKYRSEDFYSAALPQSLFDILDAFDLNASIAAACAFLEYHGFQVSKKENNE